MSERTDDELRAILSGRPQDYTAEAIEAAIEEFERRNLGDRPVARKEVTLTEASMEPDFLSNVRSLAIVIGAFALLFGSVYGVRAGWESIHAQMDAQGWIQHDRRTPVWIKGEWLTGEYRSCWMSDGIAPADPHMICLPGGEDAGPLQFAMTPDDFASFMQGAWPLISRHFHELPVSFWGRVDRKDKYIWKWRCVRREDWDHNVSLACRALN